MKKWVVEDFSTASGVPLDWELNNLEKTGRKIRQIILLWLTILIAYYTISFTAHIILKIIDIIKRVKVW